LITGGGHTGAAARLLGLFGLIASGCGPSALIVSMTEPTRPVMVTDYIDLLKVWTRHGHRRDDFDVALDFDATLHAPQFRAAYIEKYLTVYAIGPEFMAQKRAELWAETADVYELHVESQTHTYELNDFTPSKKIWRVTLLNDQNNEVLPVEVREMHERPELVVTFYPYANQFSRGWRIRFPRALADGTPLVRPDVKALTLRFAGPQGKIDVDWRLK
jgi:hypothetical protein